MATLTIKNIPEPVVKRLKQQAAAQHRSLNFQVISFLEQMTHSVPVDADALLVRARALRRAPKGVKVTDRLLEESGRPAMIVAATNLLIYLYVQGQRTAESEAVLQRDPSWAVPLLWRSEFRNVLIGLVRKHVLSLEAVSAILEEAERWLTGHEYSVMSPHFLSLAAQSGCSAYDCEFVVLAQD